jgi:acyl dehydratase
MPRHAADAQDATRAAPQVQLPDAPASESSGRTAVAACAVTIVSGWATSVVATGLIAGWWRTDRLFCIAIAFLALVFAATTITGVIMLLQHRSIGRYLIVAGAVVAVLTYGGVFVAGARVAWIVYTLWVLPVASVVLAMHPQTKRWLDA